MGHPGARRHDRMCFVEHDASPGEKRRGTMVYMLTTPTCTSSIAQLRVRVCGVGSRRKELGLGLLKEKQKSDLGLGLGLLKEKQKSELRVSRRCIEVERERDSFRSG